MTADVGSEPGRVNLVVPPGGLAGAMEASYHYDYHDSSDGVGYDGELGLPPDCSQGCVIRIADATGSEVGYEGTVTVEIGYEGTPPDEASAISLSFEPRG